MWKFCVVFVIVICFSVSLTLSQDFGYGGKHGPEHWSEDFKRCNGKHQSPINIDLVNVVEREFSPLEFTNFDAKPTGIQVSNNGHTVLVRMTFAEGDEPRVFGGPLADRSPRAGYQFEQFHFHWGENDTIGSEDRINNHAYPAELHVVLRNLEYRDFASALGQDHGIAVLAFFFQIQGADNPNYNEFVQLLSTIERKDMSANYTRPVRLQDFLSYDLMNYYSYIGSLTTPPCSEEVTWIDFETPIDISEYQLNGFRQLTAHDEHLKNNFRPIQPLNDRTIYKHKLSAPPTDKMGSIPFVNVDNFAGRISASSAYFYLLSTCLCLCLRLGLASAGFSIYVF
ncbi:uncharacterized protein Dwil_GK13282 [Drosophila willistoni]|uniref:carbonic anhydrase n=1 Tax=Drosophila willistoni TaxID=7260 RepID=B4N3T1_DROWI|nr:carbonic anhydrase 2 [Drosophila willistoni]EDW79286.2 uncharacterized protein Dwil_GK13282 [Drosophila willistoni]